MFLFPTSPSRLFPGEIFHVGIAFPPNNSYGYFFGATSVLFFIATAILAHDVSGFLFLLYFTVSLWKAVAFFSLLVFSRFGSGRELPGTPSFRGRSMPRSSSSDTSGLARQIKSFEPNADCLFFLVFHVPPFLLQFSRGPQWRG